MRSATAHERRIIRRLLGRGLGGLGEALCRLVGTEFGGRYRVEMLFAAGAEGAVFLARDVDAPDGPAPYVAKIPLLLYHKPITLDSEGIRRRRAALREEGRHLAQSASPYMPRSFGVHDMTNPLLDPARGGAFAEAEPVLVMERLPGSDLDVWLARMHRSDVDVKLLRRTLDNVTVAVLQGLWDLQERGFYYADLRPGNVRIGGRDRRARLLDAGSMVLRSDCSGRFPHVPAYLPPDLFHRIRQNVDRPFPTAAVQAVMAGRTLFEVATGRVPVPGEQVDLELLWDSRVSQPVADTIDGLCSGSFTDVQQALKYLHKHAARRVPSRIAPANGVAAAASPAPLTFADTPSPAVVRHAQETAPSSAVAVAPVVAARVAPVMPFTPAPKSDAAILPAAKPKTSWWRRLLGG
jgi:serine/threonine protein kinase